MVGDGDGEGTGVAAFSSRLTSVTATFTARTTVELMVVEYMYVYPCRYIEVKG